MAKVGLSVLVPEFVKEGIERRALEAKVSQAEVATEYLRAGMAVGAAMWARACYLADVRGSATPQEVIQEWLAEGERLTRFQ